MDASHVDTTDTEPSTAELLDLIREQRRELDELRAKVDDRPSSPPPFVGVPTPADSLTGGSTPSRRQLLRRAGQVGTVAAGAAVGASLVSRPVAAADGENMVIGFPNESSTSTTLFGSAVSFDANILTVADESRATPFKSAIGGFGLGSTVTNGVIGYSDANDTPTETGHAVVAYATSNARANLFLSTELDDPRGDTKTHNAGEVVCDNDGDLWFCVGFGAPGVWRRLSGPTTAGSLVPVDPTRVYDTRTTTDDPDGGRLFNGNQRVISVRDARNLVTGEVVAADAVPPGATAIAYNLTIVNTIGSGYLFVAPADVTAISAASINWTANTEGALANASVVKLDANRNVRVFCEGTGSTNFVIDVVGYYL